MPSKIKESSSYRYWDCKPCAGKKNEVTKDWGIWINSYFPRRPHGLLKIDTSSFLDDNLVHVNNKGSISGFDSMHLSSLVEEIQSKSFSMAMK